jgi:hypothetical protein
VSPPFALNGTVGNIPPTHVLEVQHPAVVLWTLAEKEKVRIFPSADVSEELIVQLSGTNGGLAEVSEFLDSLLQVVLCHNYAL